MRAIQLQYQCDVGTDSIPAQHGMMLLYIVGRIVVFTVIHTTLRPPTDQLLYQALEGCLRRMHVDDLIYYYVMTHRSHPHVPYDGPQVVRLHLRERDGMVTALAKASFRGTFSPKDAVMRHVYMTDVVDVLSDVVIQMGSTR